MRIVLVILAMIQIFLLYQNSFAQISNEVLLEKINTIIEEQKRLRENMKLLREDTDEKFKEMKAYSDENFRYLEPI